MPVVSLPDGTPVDFPEGTPPDVMKAAMQKHWWKANDRRAAEGKPVTPAPLPKQGEEFSPAGTGEGGFNLPTPMGVIRVPSKEDVTNFFAGAGKRADSILNRGAQILNPRDEAVQRGIAQIEAEKARRDAPLTDTAAGKTGEIATDAALTAIPAGKVMKAAGAAGGPLARTIASLGGAGAVNGLYDAGTKPVLDGETTGGNAMEGFGWGMGGQAAGNMVGKVVRGVVPAVKGAVDKVTGRVKPEFDRATLGQIADKDTITGKIYNGIEEGTGSIPVVGSVIRAQRKKGVDNWRDIIMDANGVPGESPVRGTTGQRIEGTQQAFGQAYDDALAGHEIAPDPQFRAKIFQRALDPSSGLPPDARNTLAQNVDEQYTGMFRKNPNAPLAPDEVWHGGTFDGRGVPRDGKALFTSKNRDLANSYIEMADDMAGGESGAKLHRLRADVKNPAPKEEVFKVAKDLGMDLDAQSPASLFDKNIQVPEDVDDLISALRKKGYDHAELEDMSYGGFPSRNNETAHVIFPGTRIEPSSGAMSTEATTAKAMESRLSAQARQRGNSTTPDGPAISQLTRDMRDDLRSSYRSQLPQATAARLKELDRGYVPFKTIERAATYTGNQEGQFTPAQLLQAVKTRTPASEFAARNGVLQDEADTGKQVFQNRMGDTGTADRQLLGGTIAGYGIVAHPESAIIPAAVLAGTTRPVRNFGIGATRAQLLLKKLRADEAARNSGVGLSQSVEDLLEQ